MPGCFSHPKSMYHSKIGEGTGVSLSSLDLRKNIEVVDLEVNSLKFLVLLERIHILLWYWHVLLA